MSGGKLCSDCAVDLRFGFSGVEIRCWDGELLNGIGQRIDSMSGRESDPDIGQSDLMSEEVEEIRQLAIEFEGHGLHLRRIRTNLVAKNVVGRKADRKQIGGGTAPDIFVDHQLLGKFEFVLITERCVSDNLVETSIGAIFTFTMRG